VGLGRALDLGDLHKWLVAGAQVRVGLVDRLSVASHAVEHQAVAAVGIVRDGQGLDALGPPAVHGPPQVPRDRVEVLALNKVRPRTLASPEDHVAVQVPAVGRRGELIADEGGEPAGLVVARGSVLDLVPGDFDTISGELNSLGRVLSRKAVTTRVNAARMAAGSGLNSLR
jgi:hypothetical protein